MIKRKITKKIKLGNVYIGGNAPISIQSMTNTKTKNIPQTVTQINQLVKVGCEIIRVAIPDLESAIAIKEIKNQISIPIIADIHFDYKLALSAIANGVDGLRLNPGNIGSRLKVIEVVAAAKDRQIPIRIGVNSGSIEKAKLLKYGVSPQAIIESALEHVRILEKENFYDIKISAKASDVLTTISCYRLLSEKVDYPLHLGITEAGTAQRGAIKSAIGIGTLLSEGIGDTIRVSLTASPLLEIETAKTILQSLKLRKGIEIVSCPTCGRTEINLIKLAQEVEEALVGVEQNIQVAIMGCVVNGPGEAREADFGIAGGKGEGLIFQKGEIVAKVPEENLLVALLDLINQRTP